MDNKTNLIEPNQTNASITTVEPLGDNLISNLSL